MDSQFAAKSPAHSRTQAKAGASAHARPMEQASADSRLEGNAGQLQLARHRAILGGGPHAAQLKSRAESLDNRAAGRSPAPVQRKATGGGLPPKLKSGVETLSGVSMDKVKVHYGSAEPARMNALAFARGTDIHLGPGQERHLPHEAWHVAQQAQGRVRPTAQMKSGVALNTDAGLEREADRMGERALAAPAQLMADAPPPPAEGGPPVVQAIMSLAAFQALSPGTYWKPRNQILQVDAALTTYINAGASKGADGTALQTEITNYLALAGRLTSRRNAALALQAQINAEQPLAAALGANGGLLDDLVRRAGGTVHIPYLIALVTAITPAQAGVLPQLITLAHGDPVPLLPLVQHIQPANAHHLAGLIPLAGGHTHLNRLDSLIQHATVANVLQLYPLIPLANANLADLDTLIQAAGAAHVPLLRTMIPNAGGHGEMARLAGAINLHHPGRADLAEPLTAVAATVAARFQQLAAALPLFLQTGAPGAVPGPVNNAVTAYNAVGAAPPIPFNRRISQVNFDHFLQRHTMHYFDFNQIGNVNDLWPFGAGAAADIEGLVVLALQTRRALGGANWWINPQNAVDVPVGGGRTARVGTTAQAAPPILGIPAVILGQFFPVAGGAGVIPFNAAAANAIHQLV